MKPNPIQMRSEAFAANDATPSVASRASVYITANSSATTITDFDNGVDGQFFFLVVNDANTTLDFTSSGLLGNAGANKVCASGDSAWCVYDETTDQWHVIVTDGTT